jgi:hypothetical protein
VFKNSRQAQKSKSTLKSKKITAKSGSGNSQKKISSNTKENFELGPDEKIIRYEDSSCYIGQTKSGLRSGVGIWYYWNMNKKYQGQWVLDTRHGSGVSHWQNGNIWYDGCWKHNYWHGKGALYDLDGNERCRGEWYFGEMVDRDEFDEYGSRNQFTSIGFGSPNTALYDLSNKSPPMSDRAPNPKPVRTDYQKYAQTTDDIHNSIHPHLRPQNSGPRPRKPR